MIGYVTSQAIAAGPFGSPRRRESSREFSERMEVRMGVGMEVFNRDSWLMIAIV